ERLQDEQARQQALEPVPAYEEVARGLQAMALLVLRDGNWRSWLILSGRLHSLVEKVLAIRRVTRLGDRWKRLRRKFGYIRSDMEIFSEDSRRPGPLRERRAGTTPARAAVPGARQGGRAGVPPCAGDRLPPGAARRPRRGAGRDQGGAAGVAGRPRVAPRRG